MSTVSHPNIAIIGGGPAGLTLARILQKNSISVTVFEKDATPTDRATAGGTLDLREASGQAAIRAGGLWDEYQKYARYDGQGLIISDDTGRQYFNMQDLNWGRPEIDRRHLRKILLDSLAEGTVKWGHKLRYVEADRTMVFQDGEGKEITENGFDLVIGADGAWSKVRALLCTMKPFYAGITGYELWIHDPDNNCPDVSKLAGGGSHFAAGRGDGRQLSIQRQSDRSLQINAWLQKPESWHSENGVKDHSNLEQVKALLLREFEDWAPQYKRVFEEADGAVASRNLYMMHVGTRWRHKNGFTLIGDAAHLMTPFAGEGVNQALHDSLSLAKGILETPEDVDSAAQRYEEEMYPRATAFQQTTWENTLGMFEPSANEIFAEGVKRVLEEAKKGVAKVGAAPDKLFSKH